MATGTAGSAARTFHTQQVHYLRKAVAYNTAGIGTSVKIGTLPSGAKVVNAVVHVSTVFNAATTNVLTAGTNSTAFDNIVGAGDVTEGTLGGYSAAILTAGALTLTSDTDVYARYTQSGTAATTGAATICIMFVVDNDG